MVMRKEPPIPAESLSLIGTVEGTIYIYGRIEYEDVFGRARWTNYRLMYGGREHPQGAENLKTDFAGNDTSESQRSTNPTRPGGVSASSSGCRATQPGH